MRLTKLDQGAWWWFVPAGLAVTNLGTSLSPINFGIDEFVNPRLRDSGGHKIRKPDGGAARMRVGCGGSWDSSWTARAARLSVMFITHDLSLLVEFSDRIAIMYGGVERVWGGRQMAPAPLPYPRMPRETCSP